MIQNEPPHSLTGKITLLIFVSFFISGFTGLVYEILWTRLIVRIVGASPLAVSIILTIFMGGIGLGSFLASKTIRLVQKHHQHLRIYALLELAIGILGFLLPFLMDLSKPLFSLLYNGLYDQHLIYNLLLLLGCGLLFILPTIFMGATLPFLSRFYVMSLSHLGTRLGFLYGLNTLGAAVGSVMAGFWFIYSFGVEGTMLLAVILNMIIGASCLIAASRPGIIQKKSFLKEPELLKKTESSTQISEDLNQSDYIVKGALILIVISGFCSMSYEVIWTRLLELIIGPTIYSLTIVLAAFITGLALGSMIFGRLVDRFGKAIWLLIFTQLAAAMLSLWVSQIMGSSQMFFAKLIFQFQDNFVLLSILKAGIVFLLMLAPTLCLGAAYPLVTKIYSNSTRHIGQSIGYVYAVNTIGALAGSFFAGFFLIPWFGKELSLSLLSGLMLMAPTTMIVLLLRKGKISRRRATYGVGFASLVLIMSSVLPEWDREAFAFGKYHRFEGYSHILEKTGWFASFWQGDQLPKYNINSEMVYSGDGTAGFTAVIKNVNLLGYNEYSLSNSGKPDASSHGDMATQTMAAHVPLLVHPDARDVMVLGLASGITAGEALHYPIETLDILEISKEVVESSDYFLPWNNRVLEDDRTELILQDGRAHLEITERNYDVIISEPSNPWMAGLANLFSQNFYQLIRGHLNQGGVLAQWLHSYQMDWATFQLMIRTFHSVFPNSILIHVTPGTGDYLLIGFQDEDQQFNQNLADRLQYIQSSKNVKLPDSNVLSKLIVSDDLYPLVGTGPIHTDDRPLLEYTAPRKMYTSDPLIQKNILSLRTLDSSTEKMRDAISDIDGQLSFLEYLLSVNERNIGSIDLTTATPEQFKRYSRLMIDYSSKYDLADYSILEDYPELAQKCLLAKAETIQRNIDNIPNKSAAYIYIADIYNQTDRQAERIRSLKEASRIAPNHPQIRNDLGVAFMDSGMLNAAANVFSTAILLNPNQAESHLNLGKSLLKMGLLSESETELLRSKALDPKSHESYFYLASLYFKGGQFQSAIKNYDRAIELGFGGDQDFIKDLQVHRQGSK